ncbi:D111/G-patch domain-containing protein, putative isoform 4 [Theobroma cacao]|uniref:D111/G-patch domain-containing protein, putative isoform 4 n=1 Tax=Theobroma cacao TaxID=3641 RepID=A0A061G1E6_THECC|nr:D111/G-patch domain-containing protein, putative isoform 4 [Theobroma cacao]
MAGSEEPDSTELQNSDCSFLWDPQTRLYFHASSGFYHDPDAGWYYSSRDGLYYKFENGNYVLLDSCYKEGAVADKNGEEYCSSSQGNGIGAPAKIRNVGDESGSAAGQTEGACNQVPENPQPPSEWLEDTLIDLYLSGYNAVNSAADATMSLGTDNRTDETYEIEEGEWIPEENHNLADSSEGVPYEGDTWDEENWRAQYGQVTQSGEEPVLEVPVVDLWDWVMMTGPRKDGKGQVARLIGRLVKRSAKVHPSMPSGGGLLKTAPICEVHLDLKFQQRSHVYRDRAAERRTLHGGFGLGPGQKNVAIGHDSDPTYAEDAKAEALNMSFGAGSYARRILEGMGWKEGRGTW